MKSVRDQRSGHDAALTRGSGNRKAMAKPRPARSFLAIAICTFCDRRTVLTPPLRLGHECNACRRALEVRAEIESPHCQLSPIRVSIGRDHEGDRILICPECGLQIADGIPLAPASPSLGTRP